MANIRYSDIITETITISASDVQGVNSHNSRIDGVTSAHVLIDEMLPLEIGKNVTWTTDDYGYLTLTFESAVFNVQTTFTVHLGIPVNT